MKKKRLYIIPALLSALIMGLYVTYTPVHAQSDEAPANRMSPSARRAYIRDSLRSERLKKRKSQAVSKPSVKKTTSSSSDKPNSKPASPTANTVSKKKASKSTAKKTSPARTSKSNIRRPSSSKKINIELPISDTIIVESISIRDTEIRDVLAGLAAQYSVNIMVDKDVTGPISVNLTNIALKKALKLIVEENGYELSVLHGTIKVRKPAPELPPAPPEPKLKISYENDMLTVDIQGADIEKVARKITDLTGKNITVERDAKGEITAYYKNIEFKKALKLIVENNGFRMRERDGVIIIYKDSWTGAGGAKAGSGGANTRVYVKDGMVSMEVTNASLQQLVSSITTQGDLDAIIYGQITGTVTAKLEKVPVSRALQYLFRGTDFTFWLDNDIYFIGSKQMKAITNSKLIVLKSVKADEVQTLLPAELIANMKVKLVPGQNALMVMGTYEAISTLEDYINKIDLPVAQILIEALVVDFDMDKVRNYGLNLFLGSAKAARGQETLYPEFNMTLNQKDTEKLFSGLPGLRDILSLPKNFVAKIEALEQEKVLKIKSRPQIATLNGKTASITVGQTQYFLLKQETDFNQTASTTTRTQEKFDKIQADVTLTVTPFVTGKGEITVEIVPDFSEPEGSFNSSVPPTINRRYLKSTVRLRQGETIVLGGLVKESLNSDRAQFPILGSIPVIGWLFKNHNTTKSRTQLMIFVTPHIYYGKDADVDPDEFMKTLK